MTIKHITLLTLAITSSAPFINAAGGGSAIIANHSTGGVYYWQSSSIGNQPSPTALKKGYLDAGSSVAWDTDADYLAVYPISGTGANQWWVNSLNTKSYSGPFNYNPAIQNNAKENCFTYQIAPGVLPTPNSSWGGPSTGTNDIDFIEFK